MATTSLLSSPKQTTPCGVCYPHRRVWQVCANQAGVLHTDVFYHIEGRGVHVNGEGQQHDDVKVDGVHHAWVKGKEFWLACLKSKVRCNSAKGNITKQSCRGQWSSKFDTLLTGQGHIKGKRVRRVLVEEEDEFIIMLIIKVSLAGCSEWKTLHFTFSTWISLIYFVYTAWIWLLFFVFFCFCGWFVEYYLGFTFFWIACFCTFSILSTYTDRNEKRFLFIHYYAHYQRGFLWPLRVKLILLFVFSTCISLTYFVYTASICLLFFVFLSLLLGNVDLWDISWCHMFLYHLCLYFSHIFNLNW